MNEDSDLKAIEEKISAMSPEQRSALSAQMHAEWAAIDEAAKERDRQALRQRRREALDSREAAAEALIAAVESIKPLLTDFDRRNDALREALRLAQPQHLHFPLTGEIAGLNLSGARDHLAGSRTFAEGIING